MVYAALAEDANAEELIARGPTAEQLNPLLTHSSLELVPGTLRQKDVGCWRAWENSASSQVWDQKVDPGFLIARFPPNILESCDHRLPWLCS